MLVFPALTNHILNHNTIHILFVLKYVYFNVYHFNCIHIMSCYLSILLIEKVLFFTSTFIWVIVRSEELSIYQLSMCLCPFGVWPHVHQNSNMRVETEHLLTLRVRGACEPRLWIKPHLYLSRGSRRVCVITNHILEQQTSIVRRSVTYKTWISSYPRTQIVTRSIWLLHRFGQGYPDVTWLGKEWDPHPLHIDPCWIFYLFKILVPLVMCRSAAVDSLHVADMHLFSSR